MSKTDFSKLRVGIIGAGLMGRWHGSYATRLGSQLVAVLDRDAVLAERLAAKSGSDASVYTEMDAMLGHAGLDIVHICTPLDSHYLLASQAMNAGVHVIAEKPLAATFAETETLLKMAAERDVKLCPVHQFGFQQGVFDALAADHVLGELLQLRFTVASAGGENQAASVLDEIIADVIPHPLSILQRLRSGIELDTAHWSGVHSKNGELHLLGETNGIAIDVYVSMNARPTRCEMELFYSKGKIKLNLFHGYALVETGNVSRMQKMLQPLKISLQEFFVAGSNLAKRGLYKEPAYPGLKTLLEVFYNAVSAGTAPPISPDEIRAVAKARDDISQRLLNLV